MRQPGGGQGWRGHPAEPTGRVEAVEKVSGDARRMGVSRPDQEMSCKAVAVLGTAAQLQAFSGHMKINYVYKL